MSEIIFRIRKYPWQWSSQRAICYFDTNTSKIVPLEYSGGALLEVYDPEIIAKISTFTKSFFYPIATDIGSVLPEAERSFNLYTHSYYLPSAKGEVKVLEDSGKSISFVLNNTFPKTEEKTEELENYLSFFDALSDIAKDGIFSNNLYEEILLILGEGDEENRPTYSYIASIAEPLLKLLPYFKLSLRKILVGQRQMLPINKVKELDSSCIKFLIKQPGESIKEKIAANDFKIKAVARVEKYDLLENRVLKNFLNRALKECNKYLKENNKHLKNNAAGRVSCERVIRIQLLRSVLKEILSYPVMDIIAEQETLPTPNYVLQNESHYSQIWKYYLKLVRKERQLEASFMYQDNTFKNLAELLFQAALEDTAHKTHKTFKLTELGTSLIEINKEQHLGFRTDSSAVGPFLLSTEQNYYLVTLITDVFICDDKKEVYPQYSRLKYLGTKSFLEISRMTKEGSQREWIIPIYTINAIQCRKREALSHIFEDAYSELKLAEKTIVAKDSVEGNYHIGGIIITNIDTGDLECKQSKDGIALYAMSEKPSEWGLNVIGLSDFISEYLEQITK
ncbi:MAG: DUF2357 domain-containing protein [Succinivibrio sp.]